MLRELLWRLLVPPLPPEASADKAVEKGVSAFEGPSAADGVTYDMQLTTNELAALFALKGWVVDGASSSDSTPNAAEIMRLIHHNATAVADGEIDAYAARARLLAINNENYPGTTDLYLYIGEVTNQLSDDDDEEPDYFAA